MAKFLTKLIYSTVEGQNRLWITEAPFLVYSDIAGHIDIPAGFMWNGNSLPRIAWIESLPTDYMETGCIHDFCYRYGKDRKVADQVYREFIELQGAGKVRRNFRYAVLRLFGGSHFNKRDD